MEILIMNVHKSDNKIEFTKQVLPAANRQFGKMAALSRPKFSVTLQACGLIVPKRSANSALEESVEGSEASEY